MERKKKILIAVVLWVLLLIALKLEMKAEVNGCYPPPLKPLPPIGCKDVVGQCVCSKGVCHWEWVCVPA